MKKTLLSLALLAGLSANAQLTNGSIATNFTVTAYQSALSTEGLNNDGTYTLYDYLDAGYTVIMDVSATWCNPCWNYHTSNALEDLYYNHGPAGFPGVSPTTTDDVMVIWVEGDGTTADATMLDGSGTPGNWINPTGSAEVPFPMANPAQALANQINNDYAIGYFPTIYKICPNRVVTEVGQQNAANLYTSVGSCPAPASQPADAAMLQYLAGTEICPGAAYVPSVKIQNNGLSNLTDATVTITLNGNTVSTGTFSGNLATYEVATVTCSAIAAPAAGALVATVTTTGDASASNGSVNATLAIAPTATASNATVKVSTDAYGSELTWNIKNSANVTVASGGPYADQSSAGAYPQADVNFTLVSNECYTINLMDSYGDGFDSGYGDGSFKVQVNGVDLVVAPSWATDALQKKMASGTLSLEEESIAGFNVYPNPASDLVNVAFNANGGDYTVSIVDVTGRILVTKTITTVKGDQTVELPVAGLAAGNYMVTLRTVGGVSTSHVVIK
jgi:hypothetical protein